MTNTWEAQVNLISGINIQQKRFEMIFGVGHKGSGDQQLTQSLSHWENKIRRKLTRKISYKFDFRRREYLEYKSP